VDYYQLVVPFMTQQYGDELTTQLALLVHTNTGCEYEDHSKWALWAGQKWQVHKLANFDCVQCCNTAR
jgi:aromatic ring-cleaving dioxygenase